MSDNPPPLGPDHAELGRLLETQLEAEGWPVALLDQFLAHLAEHAAGIDLDSFDERPRAERLALLIGSGLPACAPDAILGTLDDLAAADRERAREAWLGS